MGGFGSGRWYRSRGRKTTKEEALDLSVKNFRKWLGFGGTGTSTWTFTNGNKSSINFFLDWKANSPLLTLSYCLNKTKDVRFSILLQSTPVHFGGSRWWFTCPLILNGAPCLRRVGKLYLPPGATYFGCRHCHDLSYESSQSAHRVERVFQLMGFEKEIAQLWKQRHGVC